MGKQWKKEGKIDISNKKGRLFTKISREIQVAARTNSNPQSNPRLRSALLWARSQSMPTKTIQRALEKGDNKKFIEEVLYEGFAPFGVGIIVLCFTDNKVRTVAGIRSIFKKHGGNMGGSVLWMFDKVGRIECEIKENCDFTQEAIEVGAIDFNTTLDKGVYYFCDVKDISLVKKNLEGRGWRIIHFQIIYKSKQVQKLSLEQKEEVCTLIEDLENQDDCQEIFYSCEPCKLL